MSGNDNENKQTNVTNSNGNPQPLTRQELSESYLNLVKIHNEKSELYQKHRDAIPTGDYTAENTKEAAELYEQYKQMAEQLELAKQQFEKQLSNAGKLNFEELNCKVKVYDLLLADSIDDESVDSDESRIAHSLGDKVRRNSITRAGFGIRSKRDTIVDQLDAAKYEQELRANQIVNGFADNQISLENELRTVNADLGSLRESQGDPQRINELSGKQQELLTQLNHLQEEHRRAKNIQDQYADQKGKVDLFSKRNRISEINEISDINNEFVALESKPDTDELITPGFEPDLDNNESQINDKLNEDPLESNPDYRQLKSYFADVKYIVDDRNSIAYDYRMYQSEPEYSNDVYNSFVKRSAGLDEHKQMFEEYFNSIDSPTTEMQQLKADYCKLLQLDYANTFNILTAESKNVAIGDHDKSSHIISQLTQLSNDKVAVDIQLANAQKAIDAYNTVSLNNQPLQYENNEINVNNDNNTGNNNNIAENEQKQNEFISPDIVLNELENNQPLQPENNEINVNENNNIVNVDDNIIAENTEKQNEPEKVEVVANNNNVIAEEPKKEEPKQEVKAEPKQEVKEEPKQEIKAEPKQEVKQEVKEEPKEPSPLEQSFQNVKAMFERRAAAHKTHTELNSIALAYVTESVVKRSVEAFKEFRRVESESEFISAVRNFEEKINAISEPTLDDLNLKAEFYKLYRDDFVKTKQICENERANSKYFKEPDPVIKGVIDKKLNGADERIKAANDKYNAALKQRKDFTTQHRLPEVVDANSAPTNTALTKEQAATFLRIAHERQLAKVFLTLNDLENNIDTIKTLKSYRKVTAIHDAVKKFPKFFDQIRTHGFTYKSYDLAYDIRNAPKLLCKYDDEALTEEEQKSVDNGNSFVVRMVDDKDDIANENRSIKRLEKRWNEIHSNFKAEYDKTGVLKTYDEGMYEIAVNLAKESGFDMSRLNRNEVESLYNKTFGNARIMERPGNVSKNPNFETTLYDALHAKFVSRNYGKIGERKEQFSYFENSDDLLDEYKLDMARDEAVYNRENANLKLDETPEEVAKMFGNKYVARMKKLTEEKNVVRDGETVKERVRKEKYTRKDLTKTMSQFAALAKIHNQDGRKPRFYGIKALFGAKSVQGYKQEQEVYDAYKKALKNLGVSDATINYLSDPKRNGKLPSAGIIEKELVATETQREKMLAMQKRFENDRRKEEEKRKQQEVREYRKSAKNKDLSFMNIEDMSSALDENYDDFLPYENVDEDENELNTANKVNEQKVNKTLLSHDDKEQLRALVEGDKNNNNLQSEGQGKQFVKQGDKQNDEKSLNKSDKEKKGI